MITSPGDALDFAIRQTFIFNDFYALHSKRSSVYPSAGLGGLALFLCLASPAGAIVVNGLNSYTGAVSGSSPSYDGVDLSGVVEVLLNNGATGCTGSLLADGFSVLTAGHCITNAYGDALPFSGTVTFLGPTGTSSNVTDHVSAYFVDPAWTGTGTQGGDLAVLRLSTAAPSWAAEYSLYTGSMPTGSGADEVMAGYGLGGTGLTGGSTPLGTLRVGTNDYVESGKAFDATWSAGLYVGEFYDPGLTSTNALGSIVDPNPYSAGDEVDIASGDSGGPSFYNGEIVGVHDLGICLGSGSCNVPPSVGSANNSYFGEMYGDTSASANATWIDEQLVPEPASFVLFGLGLAILVAGKRRSSNSPKPSR